MNDSVTGRAIGIDTAAAQKDIADKFWYEWGPKWPLLDRTSQDRALADLALRLLKGSGNATITHVPGWDRITFDPSSGSHIDPDPTTDGATTFVRPMPALAQQHDPGTGEFIALWLKTGAGENDWTKLGAGDGGTTATTRLYLCDFEADMDGFKEPQSLQLEPPTTAARDVSVTAGAAANLVFANSTNLMPKVVIWPAGRWKLHVFVKTDGGPGVVTFALKRMKSDGSAFVTLATGVATVATSSTSYGAQNLTVDVAETAGLLADEIYLEAEGSTSSGTAVQVFVGMGGAQASYIELPFAATAVISHPELTNRDISHQHPDLAIDVAASGFTKNLSSADDTLAKALHTLDLLAALGSIWHGGSGVPSSGLGANGDWYLNLTNCDVYGPKTAGAWGSVVGNIKGAPGDPGGPGLDGANGAEGPAGPSPLGYFYPTVNVSGLLARAEELRDSWSGTPHAIASTPVIASSGYVPFFTGLRNIPLESWPAGLWKIRARLKSSNASLNATCRVTANWKQPGGYALAVFQATFEITSTDYVVFEHSDTAPHMVASTADSLELVFEVHTTGSSPVSVTLEIDDANHDTRLETTLAIPVGLVAVKLLDTPGYAYDKIEVAAGLVKSYGGAAPNQTVLLALANPRKPNVDAVFSPNVETENPLGGFDAGPAGTWTRNSYGALPAYFTDGVTPVANMRVLVYSPGVSSDNEPFQGIYRLAVVGDGSHYTQLVRADDADTGAEYTDQMEVLCLGGAVYAGSLFVLTSAQPIVLEVSPITLARMSIGSGGLVALGVVGGSNRINLGGPDNNRSAVPTVGEAQQVDPSTYASSAVWRFQCVAAVANAGTSGTVVLYNLTDSSVAATLTVTGTTPALYSATLTVPTNLPNAAKLYEARFQMVAPLPTDKIIVSSITLTASAA